MNGLVPCCGVLLYLILALTGTEAIGPLPNYTLIQSNLLWRHGDRSPIYTYEGDPNIDKWPQGLGQLTQLGMNQHYNLGQYLRTRYMDTGFLSATTYNRKDVFVRCTDIDRTLMSAESDLVGLFPPSGIQKWNKNLDWQPIPIHTINLAEDELLDVLQNCPMLDHLELITEQSDEYLEMEAKYNHVIEVTARETNVDPYLVDIEFTIDNLFCCEQHNMTLPEWASDPGFMANLTVLGAYRLSTYFNSKEKSRLTGGKFLGLMRENLKNATDFSILSKKINIYSAHDTTVAAYLSTLEMHNQLWPPYASCVLTELYMDDESSFFVQVSFRNDSTRDPYVLKHPECGELCPLETFIELAEPYVPENRMKECEIPEPRKVMSMLAIEVLSGAGGVILLIIIVTIVVKTCRTNRSHWYGKMATHSEAA